MKPLVIDKVASVAAACDIGREARVSAIPVRFAAAEPGERRISEDGNKYAC